MHTHEHTNAKSKRLDWCSFTYVSLEITVAAYIYTANVQEMIANINSVDLKCLKIAFWKEEIENVSERECLLTECSSTCLLTCVQVKKNFIVKAGHEHFKGLVYSSQYCSSTNKLYKVCHRRQ